MSTITPEDVSQPPTNSITMNNVYGLHHHASNAEQASTIMPEDILQTPTMRSMTIADAHDLQHRANNAEKELSIQRTKLAHEKRRTRQFETQVNEYTEALTRCVQDCTLMRTHCQILSNSNLALSGELQKAKLMVETLEAVIQMLYTTDRCGSASAAPYGGTVPI